MYSVLCQMSVITYFYIVLLSKYQSLFCSIHSVVELSITEVRSPLWKELNFPLNPLPVLLTTRGDNGLGDLPGVRVAHDATHIQDGPEDVCPSHHWGTSRSTNPTSCSWIWGQGGWQLWRDKGDGFEDSSCWGKKNYIMVWEEKTYTHIHTYLFTYTCTSIYWLKTNYEKLSLGLKVDTVLHMHTLTCTLSLTGYLCDSCSVHVQPLRAYNDTIIYS